MLGFRLRGLLRLDFKLAQRLCARHIVAFGICTDFYRIAARLGGNGRGGVVFVVHIPDRVIILRQAAGGLDFKVQLFAFLKGDALVAQCFAVQHSIKVCICQLGLDGKSPSSPKLLFVITVFDIGAILTRFFRRSCCVRRMVNVAVVVINDGIIFQLIGVYALYQLDDICAVFLFDRFKVVLRRSTLDAERPLVIRDGVAVLVGDSCLIVACIVGGGSFIQLLPSVAVLLPVNNGIIIYNQIVVNVYEFPAAIGVLYKLEIVHRRLDFFFDGDINNDIAIRHRETVAAVFARLNGSRILADYKLNFLDDLTDCQLRVNGEWLASRCFLLVQLFAVLLDRDSMLYFCIAQLQRFQLTEVGVFPNLNIQAIFRQITNRQICARYVAGFRRIFNLVQINVFAVDALDIIQRGQLDPYICAKRIIIIDLPVCLIAADFCISSTA